MKRVLFLDIDGVLHRCHRSDEPTIATTPLCDLLELRPDLFGWAPNLADALGDLDCDIVIHSSWRRYLPDEDIQTCLGPLADRFRGCTNRALLREASIDAMVEVLTPRGVSFLVLDDEPLTLALAGSCAFVLCPPQAGVSDPTVLSRLHRWVRASP